MLTVVDRSLKHTQSVNQSNVFYKPLASAQTAEEQQITHIHIEIALKTDMGINVYFCSTPATLPCVVIIIIIIFKYSQQKRSPEF